MNTNEFDRLLKEKIEQTSFAYKESDWQQLADKLPAEKSRRILPFWVTVIAASIILLAGGYGLLRMTQQSPLPTPELPPTSLSNASQPPLASPTLPMHESSVAPSIAVSHAPIHTTVITNANSSSTSNKLLYPTTHEPAAEEPVSTENNIGMAFQDLVSPITAPSQLQEEQTKSPTSTAASETHPLLQKPTVHTQAEKLPSLAAFEDISETPQKKHHPISFHIAGGFNYGSLNAGYSATINAKRMLGDKLFLEGGLGFVQNQDIMAASMSTSQYNNVYNNNSRGKAARVTKEVKGIYYLQMAPSFGYELWKKLSVGIGADIQRLLDGSQESRPVVVSEEGFKLIPIWDAGVMGKAEYTIGKSITAGIAYREGINNIVTGTDNYYNRRYFQAQLKWKFLGK